jgi:hypothetical protein
MRNLAKARTLSAADNDAGYQLFGLTLLALVPALFWTLVIAAVGSAIGHPLGIATLVTIGAAIATFVLTAVATLFARAH